MPCRSGGNATVRGGREAGKATGPEIVIGRRSGPVDGGGLCRLSASAAEPARPAARAERILFRAQGDRRLVISSGRLSTREEIDLDLADAPGAGFDLTGADAVILRRAAAVL